MSPPEMQTPAGAGVGAGLGKTAEASSSIARPSCAKAAAMALYLHGILPLEQVAAMFKRNPVWRAA